MASSVVRIPPRFMAMAAVLAMIFSMVGYLSAAFAQEWLQIQWMAGPGWVGTAVEASRETYDSASDVIIAAGWNSPDALAAAGLSGVVGAPILLVNDVRDEATGATLGEIALLGAETVHIAGGDAAVSASIETEIAAAGDWELNRFAGVDRFATAAQMAGAFDAAVEQQCRAAGITGNFCPSPADGKEDDYEAIERAKRTTPALRRALDNIELQEMLPTPTCITPCCGGVRLCTVDR